MSQRRSRIRPTWHKRRSSWFRKSEIEHLEPRRLLSASHIPTLLAGTAQFTGSLTNGQVEPSIAVDPTNPNRQFVISNNQTSGGVHGVGLFAAYRTQVGKKWKW